MWLPSFPVPSAVLPAGVFVSSPFLAATSTWFEVWVVVRVISVTLLILRIFSRIFSGSSARPAPVRTTPTRYSPASSRFAPPPAPVSSPWPRFLLIAVLVGGCAFAAWKFLLPEISPATSTTAQMRSVQSVVASYMYSKASSPSSIQFLDWSDLKSSGADWLITVHYKAMQRSGEWTTATVRFTVHSGAVASAQVLGQG